MFAFLRRKPDPSEAGRSLARENARQRKMRVRARVEQMCLDMGKPLPRWPS